MSKKLFVGNLPFQTSSGDLEQIFVEAGTVESATVITDAVTGRSRGFGFVEMSSEEEAQEAIKLLNGKEIDGRNLTVNVARPRTERGPGGGGGGGGRKRGSGRGGFNSRRW